VVQFEALVIPVGAPLSIAMGEVILVVADGPRALNESGKLPPPVVALQVLLPLLLQIEKPQLLLLLS